MSVSIRVLYNHVTGEGQKLDGVKMLSFKQGWGFLSMTGMKSAWAKKVLKWRLILISSGEHVAVGGENA
eukprot:11220053-Lingulodinium_polyedra.AAC.1